MAALNPDIATEAQALARRLADPSVRLVACLCAEWCGACREYRETFDRIANAHPSLCFAWIDIENQADRLDDIDVENFPTILVEDPVGTRFYGTVLPQAGVLERLLAQIDALGCDADAPELRTLLSAMPV